MKKYMKGTAPAIQYSSNGYTPVWNFNAEVSGWQGVHPIIELDDEQGELLLAAGGIQIDGDAKPINLHE